MASAPSLQSIQRADSLGLLGGGGEAGTAGAAATAAQRAMRSGRDSAEPVGPSTPATSIYRERPRKRSWADLAGEANLGWFSSAHVGPVWRSKWGTPCTVPVATPLRHALRSKREQSAASVCPKLAILHPHLQMRSHQ